jgi:DNA-binding NtrC family response regulator
VARADDHGDSMTAELPTLRALRPDAAALSEVRVTLTSPDDAPSSATLGLGTLVVGTDAACDIVLADRRVSRRHCELRLTTDGVLLRDLGSKNGTFVGRVKIVEAILPAGETVRVGDSVLRVDATGETSLVPLSAAASFGAALGGSLVMRALFATLRKLAASSETALLLGESGTGKEVLARAIHDASPRSRGPFVVFDASATAPSLIESELFGHEQGAFTGAVTARAGMLEEAHGGTLFIDEIGELPLELQPTLLRVLETRQARRVGGSGLRSFDVRIVAASHRDLRCRVAAGDFRQDLFYRLAVVEAHVPALRERKDDIPLLVERFLASAQPPRRLDELPGGTLEMLSRHDWPGNVRELRNTVARILLFPEDPSEAILPPLAGGANLGEAASRLLRIPLRQARELASDQFEEGYIRENLRRHTGNVTRAAEAMGISRQLLYRLMDRHGIRRETLEE